MHILNYLNHSVHDTNRDGMAAAGCDNPLAKDTVRVEYRLTCSGTLHPANAQGNWTRSEGSRILLRQPFQLVVVSRPYDQYPQELALRFDAPWVMDDDGGISHYCHPDVEIASDLAALLTLLCRRLITVAVKVREFHDPSYAGSFLADLPMPIVLEKSASHWSQRPVWLLHGVDGVSVRSHHPPPVPFDSGYMAECLRALPGLGVAPALVRAARLYASAMENIETQFETSYQLLVSAVETMAGAVLTGWEPSDDEKISAKREFVAEAIERENLSISVAGRLALTASKGNRWSRRKFKKFLLDYCDKSIISEQDDLFMVPPEMCPDENGIGKAIDEVYDARSGMHHSGQSFPASAAIGPSVKVAAKAFNDLFLQRRPFPPIGWFERIVSTAICRYIGAEVARLSVGDRNPTEESL